MNPMNPTYHTPLVNWNLFICREPYQKYSILDGSINEPDGSIISRLLSAIVAPSSKNWGYISDQHWGVWRHWISNSTIGENNTASQTKGARKRSPNPRWGYRDTHDFMSYSGCLLKGRQIELPSADHHTSSTAQGGGGSFKNRKPIGDVGCCESGMAERSYWLTERWLELCLLEWLQWLQWSPHPQLLDVVWCTATVVVVVA